MRPPFTTTNFGLAIALHAAGVPIIEVQNIFTPQMLAKWGFKRAEEAVRAGKQGKIKFWIEPTDRLEQLVSAYNDQAKASGDENGEIPDGIPDDIRAIRIVAHSQKIRNAINDELKKLHSAWEFHEDRTATEAERQALERQLQSGKEFTVNIPGFKFVNAAASEKTRKRLGL